MFREATITAAVLIGILITGVSPLSAQDTTGTYSSEILSAPVTTATESSESAAPVPASDSTSTAPAQTGMPANEPSTAETDPITTIPAVTAVNATTQSIVDQQTTPTTVSAAETTSTSVDSPTSVTLPEGVIYQVLKPGTGPKTETTSTRLIHYTLYLSDGTKVESSRDAEFPVPFQFTPGSGEAILGMEKGTDNMRVGEMRRVFIPSELAYGSSGHGENIPPDSDLIFEVELVDIKASDDKSDTKLAL